MSDMSATLASPEEEALVAQMQDKLSADFESLPDAPELVGEIRLLRFLRGHGTVDDAVKAYREMLNLRKEWNVDAIRAQIMANDLSLDAAPHREALKKAGSSPIFDAGRSNEGDIVVITFPGQVNVPLLMEVSEEDWLENQLYNLERNSIVMDRESRAQGRMARSFRIMNLSGVGSNILSGPLRGRLQRVTQVVQICYPESLSHVKIIEAPSFFSLLYAVVRPMLNARTVARIQVMDSDYKKTLMSQVDSDAIKVIASSDVGRAVLAPVGAGTVTVGAWSKAEVPVSVNNGDTVVWKFECNSKLSFSVNGLFAGADRCVEFVTPTSTTSNEGSCVATGDGVISVVFDNSAAWMFSSTVTYEVTGASS